MDGITQILDPITSRIEEFARTGEPPQYISEAFGGIAIGEVISALERKFTRGWLRVGLMVAGAVTSFYIAGKSSRDRVKMEGAVIGSDLLINAVKEVIFNKDEVIETAKASIEAVKSGNLAAIPSHVTNTTAPVQAVTSYAPPEVVEVESTYTPPPSEGPEIIVKAI